MNLKPHKDLVRVDGQTKGYAIRIGNKVPKNSANLAYVQSKSVSPKDNILLEDVSLEIKENGLSDFIAKDYVVYPRDNFLLETENGETLFPTDSVVITDEFTVRKNRQDTHKPVFYRMELKGRFDARTTQVLPYEGGYTSHTVQEALSLYDILPDKRNELIYAGDSIRVEMNGHPLPAGDSFKVQLILEDNFLYRIILFTSFQNSDGTTYKVIYPDYQEERATSEIKEETLKAYPFFEQVTMDQFNILKDEMAANPDQYKHKKAYAIEERSSGYHLYATSDLMIANYNTRPPQNFKHRLEAKLQTKLSAMNPGKLNIGFVFFHDVQGVENLSSVGRTLNNSSYLPSYLELVNPHTTDAYLKSDIRYWGIDLDMPEHHYEDYDIIILTGYGNANVSAYIDKFKHYLEGGGTLWVDNAGTGEKVLKFTNNKGNSFVSNISFSTGTNEFGVKQVVGNHIYNNRLYPISDVSEIGYENVSPSMSYGVNELPEEWEKIIKHLNGGASVMKKTLLRAGTVIFSSCGLFRAIYHNQEESVKFALNVFMNHAEEKWVLTPWRNEFVYHKDNLFLQEYKVENTDAYINDRNDYDMNQIVAKKILYRNCRDYVKVFLDPSFYNATGVYYHNIKGEVSVEISNSDFEAGSYQANGTPVTQWTTNTNNAIPGWNVKKLAGQTVTFLHGNEPTQFGLRQAVIDSTNSSVGAHAFWESQEYFLAADDYKATVYVQTNAIKGITTDGAKLGVYNAAGEVVATSIAISGTRGWTKVEMSFSNPKAQTVYVRLGFVDGNGFGRASFDRITFETIGYVKGTPENSGEKMLYAFTTKPSAVTIDLEEEGFSSGNITRVIPDVLFNYTIKPFIHRWESFGMDGTTGLEYGRFQRIYGPGISYSKKISKSEGLKNLGYLHTLLPAIPAGDEWADWNKIYYSITLGSETVAENNLVNLKLFNRQTGTEWYFHDELVIGFKDIHGGTINPSYVLHAETNYETIRASKRNFGVKLLNDQSIYLELPQTKDAKENWYIRIHNGRFSKDSLGYKEWSELHNSNGKDDFKNRSVRKYNYSIDEYYEQIFDPSIGIMTVENEVEYLTPLTVKVPHNHLHMIDGSISMEQLTPIAESSLGGTRFEAEQKDWVRSKGPQIYIDLNNNGNIQLVKESFPYEIDFAKGIVRFPNHKITGKVYASYHHQNFRLYRRLYRNVRISDELLTNKRIDEKTGEVYLYGSKQNWLTTPVPVVKNVRGRSTAQNMIPVSNYRIDYEEGAVIFLAEPATEIYVDYGYFDAEEITVKDYDIENGILILGQNISFLDDLYAKYSYYENFYDYKGYYDESSKTFYHLDLNPSVGHFSTMPSTSYLNGKEIATYDLVSSSQLLNKLIHVYIVPDSVEGSSIRHCFSREEWQKIQRANPMYLLLGRVQVREHTNVNDVVVMDARVRGGGISKNLSVKQIEQRVGGKQRYWDIAGWNGKAFYRNGVLIINIPKSILAEQGGTLSQEYVDEVITKHIAYGTYYIIEWM